MAQKSLPGNRKLPDYEWNTLPEGKVYLFPAGSERFLAGNHPVRWVSLIFFGTEGTGCFIFAGGELSHFWDIY